MIIEVDMYYQIRSFYNEGKSIRWIAKTLGISRQTVRKYCEGDTHPDIRKDYSREPTVVNDAVKEFIVNCFREDDREGLAKQKHTARKIYDRLVNEMGFSGGESTIRRTVREIRKEYQVPPQADVPLEYDPGDAIQIDWGECTVYLDGVKTKLNFFCGRLCYSCAIFVQVFFRQNIESFLEAQQRMFDFFGGVPGRLIFDNARVAVKEGFGQHAKVTDSYASFAAHYAFRTDFCNIASGNEKGLVENLVGLSRRNFMVPVPRVNDIEELNQKLLSDCRRYISSHKVASRKCPVSEDYAREQRFLHVIPGYKFDTGKTAFSKVSDYSTVRFDKNDYSVPVRFVGKKVTVKGYADTVHIIYNRELIASFDREYRTRHTSYRLEHYIELLERKPRCVFQAKPVRATIAHELMDWGKQLPGGNAEMVRLLRLCVDYGEDRVLSAKYALPSGVIPTVDLIRSQLYEPAESNIIYINNEISIESTDLHRFDEKCGVI